MINRPCHQKKKWYRQDDLKKKYADDEVPAIRELSIMIGNITFGKDNVKFQTLRARALISIYYLTACRVSEILPEKDSEYMGILKEQISFERYNNREVMFIRTKNRKHKKKHTKRQPIPIEFEYEIVKYVKEYISNLEEQQPLFNFSKQRAIQIINQTIGFNAHFIRHIRLTHLVTLYDFNSQALVKYAGWSSIEPSKHYMELSPKDILNEFYKNSKEE